MSSTAISSDATASTVHLTYVNPSELYDPTPNGYSHAVVASSGTRVAYIAGQGGEDRSGALSPTFEDQVRQACSNLEAVLLSVGATPGKVARITTYVVDYDESKLKVMTNHIQALFGDKLPAQTLVPVPRLALDGMLFEVDATAILDSEAVSTGRQVVRRAGEQSNSGANA
ncbi:MAG: RidA family protein [Woeseiaceae bacterium]|nr:RidA family protein [Woeseiaceae bacterium]